MTFDTLIKNAHIATMNSEFGFGAGVPYGQIFDGAVAIKDGKIAWIGQDDDTIHADNVIDVHGRWLTPALIDCHTHLVYGGNRSGEFEQRLEGVDYATIAKNGGGIMSTVNSVRQASIDELYEQSAKRLVALMQDGVGTVEIKSGYGLDLDNERKMLQVAKRLGEHFGITVQKTYLGLHALPLEYKDRADAYVDKACEWLKVLHGEGLVDAVDGFMEHIAFNGEQMTKMFNTAKELGLPVKLHAEQLSDMNGAALVASFDGLSADHVEYLSESSIKKMAEHGTTAVLLPTAFYVLKETKKPPIELLRHYGINMAVSTDSNPGTSPSTSLLLAMNMACTLFGLTCEEALAGVSVYASQALGLSHKKGQIKVGMDADLALWEIERPADLSYLIGERRLFKTIMAGVV